MDATKRIFVSFPAQDSHFRDLLRGQAKHDKTPFDFVDMSVKEPWESEWKTRCRTKIRGCDGLIAIITENSCTADGQIWEIECGIAEQVPVIGLYAYSNKSVRIPKVLSGRRVILWSWDAVARFIDSL